jgi:hypothetical protein
MMAIHVLFAVPNGTTVNANFTCTSSERNVGNGWINITFIDGFHVEAQRKIVSAQFCSAGAVFTYEEQ